MIWSRAAAPNALYVTLGMPVTPIEQITGVAELLGGRVKTLHPAVLAGILARDDEADLDELRRNGFAPIALVVCNLYPFQRTVAGPNVADCRRHRAD